MIRFVEGGRIQAKLPGRYKGGRRRREPPIEVRCWIEGCPWRRCATPKRLEEALNRHLREKHSTID